jgi:predicted nucleic acid-binding protein
MESSVKQVKATEILDTQNIILSTQIINEVCVNLLKKAQYTEEEIKQTIYNLYVKYDVAILNQDIILYASTIRENNSISYWDSLVIATAIKNNCTVIYSEDMQHNQIIQNLRIENPFKK